MRINSLEYGSLLSYASHGSTPQIQQARSIMLAVKNDEFVEQPPIQMSHWIARTVQQNISALPFKAFLSETTVLVPVPRTTLMKPDTLWVPSNIASALAKRGLGRGVLACLVRKEPLRKSAWSDPSERPTPTEQYNTLAVQGQIADPPPTDITLVDDIITRGHTLIGAANRLLDAYPKTRIRAFVAMRTISNPLEFVEGYAPVSGWINYRELEDDAIRRP